ncbi:MAG: WYL domain-containing protein [Bacteroidales bacterium]|nr:WYL domain-containing protein [Bacteroidales bacterium]
MSKRESFSRYSLIYNKIKRRPVNFIEIMDYLALQSELQSYNFIVSKRTFQRDLEDIRSLFDIDIQYDYSLKAYRVVSDDNPESHERFFEALDITNALKFKDGFSNHIHIEKRRSGGTESLYGLVHAIKNKVQIKFSYQKFHDENPTERNAEPYALKEFKNRWYVLAKDLKNNQVKCFALDRLSELEITKKKFQLQSDFNVNEHFKFSFGIISPNAGKPQEVILSFKPYQGKYIKSLPLHDSQVILIDTEKEFRILLNLFITHDFIMELLSHGENAKVIQPKSLIHDLKESYKKALERYS